MKREKFGSSFGAIAAFAGSAVGLGNLWRFPYMVGEYGGFAFILVYILCVFLLCLPIFIAEMVIGRRGRANAYGAIKNISPNSKWKYIGALFIITPFLIVSYYSVVGGWSIDYLFKSLAFRFTAVGDAAELSNMFGGFVSSVSSPLVCHTLFMLITAGITYLGIEKFGKVMTPMLFVTIGIIAVWVMTLDGASEGIAYLFKPDFSKITPAVCLAAMGQAFFSLSIAAGPIISYASYLSEDISIGSHSSYTAVADFVFAILAGCAIMPAVFAFGINPGSGPSLVFETLPFIFSKIPLGGLIAILFFLTLLIAAITSSISMFEPVVTFIQEEWKLSRAKASILTFVTAWGLGVVFSLSFGPLSGVKILDNSLFDCIDKLCSNVLMPVAALLMVIYVGWKMNRSEFFDEYTSRGRSSFGKVTARPLYFLLRYVAPLVIIAVFLSAIFA